MRKIYLVDDATLDTVFRCVVCGREERYQGDHFERFEGSLVSEPSALDEAWDNHIESSPECEDGRIYTVADRGAW